MTEVEYQHECSRAELLGLPKPTWEEFLNSRKEGETDAVGEEEENMTAEEAENTDSRKEGIRRIGGGLDELNSILSRTQVKINRFKAACGSFSNVLKLHMGLKRVDEEGQQEGNANDSNNMPISEVLILEENKTNDGEKSGSTIDNTSPYQKSPKKKPDSELDKLDSLISKAERAELSLSSQNKQMRKFLN